MQQATTDPDQMLTFLDTCINSISHGFILVAIGFILFSLMERIFRLHSIKKPFRATLLDLQYAFISMLYPPFIYFVLSAVFGFVAVQTQITAHNPQLAVLFFAGQLFAVLFARDCLIYLRHRIFHLRPVWSFHSIHHSSEEVNWISAVRFHPAENIIEATGEVLLFLGCDIIRRGSGSAFHGCLDHGFLQSLYPFQPPLDVRAVALRHCQPGLSPLASFRHAGGAGQKFCSHVFDP